MVSDEMKVQYIMGILIKVDRIVARSGGEWTIDAIFAKEDLKDFLVKAMEADQAAVDARYNDGDGDLPA